MQSTHLWNTARFFNLISIFFTEFQIKFTVHAVKKKKQFGVFMNIQSNYCNNTIQWTANWWFFFNHTVYEITLDFLICIIIDLFSGLQWTLAFSRAIKTTILSLTELFTNVKCNIKFHYTVPWICIMAHVRYFIQLAIAVSEVYHRRAFKTFIIIWYIHRLRIVFENYAMATKYYKP